MEETIKAILEENFSDYKEYHLYILAGFTLTIAIIQTLQSIIVSQKIEQFKTELKRSELKFSRYNDLQIKALSKIYPLLFEFQSKTIKISNSIGINPDKYEKIAKEWVLSYSKCYNELAREKYILPTQIKDSFSSMINEFTKIWNLIHEEKKYQNLFFLDDFGQVRQGADPEDIKEIHENLVKYDRDGIMSKSIKNISTLREEIEKHFKEME